ncbi:hypothetical protein [Pseudoduganella namucuonensis]|uniref:hypothetical protein n=1 Tax=Pseudoduganella namucuonensis TaxID=1035707 RepID=UPI00116028AF|nr:hypothetical protein [Pseudoduganella namucuonensis]
MIFSAQALALALALAQASAGMSAHPGPIRPQVHGKSGKITLGPLCIARKRCEILWAQFSVTAIVKIVNSKTHFSQSTHKTRYADGHLSSKQR